MKITVVTSRSVLRRLHPLLSVPLGSPPPAAGPLTERKRNKRADGGGTHSSWMRLIQTRPMQQAACSLCACLARVHRYRPLLRMPRWRAGGQPRPVCSLPVLIINCDRELQLLSFTRLTKSSRQPGRPAVEKSAT